MAKYKSFASSLIDLVGQANEEKRVFNFGPWFIVSTLKSKFRKR